MKFVFEYKGQPAIVLAFIMTIDLIVQGDDNFNFNVVLSNGDHHNFAFGSKPSASKARNKLIKMLNNYYMYQIKI
jgi:hypothetical protein